MPLHKNKSEYEDIGAIRGSTGDTIHCMTWCDRSHEECVLRDRVAWASPDHPKRMS